MDLSSLGSSILLSVGAALSTWIVSMVRGKKADSFADLIRGIGKQIVHDLVAGVGAAEADADLLRLRARELMLAAIKRLELPDNAITEAIVTATIEHSVGDAQKELRAIDAADVAVTTVAARSKIVAGSFAAAEARGRAQTFDADYQAMIERTPAVPPAIPPTTKEEKR